MANSIHYLVADKIREILLNDLQTSIPQSDPAYADIVRVGLYQENPKREDANVFAIITSGMRGRDDVFDGLVTLGAFENIGFKPPVQEMGGGVSWFRIFEVEYGLYYIKGNLSEEEALNAAGVLQQRIIKSLDGRTVNVCDDFGECVCQLFVVKAGMFETGGRKPNTYIWRGKVIVYALSERD